MVENTSPLHERHPTEFLCDVLLPGEFAKSASPYGSHHGLLTGSSFGMAFDVRAEVYFSHIDVHFTNIMIQNNNHPDREHGLPLSRTIRAPYIDRPRTPFIKKDIELR